jgi:hypothetical protein
MAQLKTDLALAKADVGLSNVDNTSDAAKPISTATQTALDAKQGLDADLTAIGGLTPTNDDIIQRKAGAWINRTMAQLKTDFALAKGDVGLGNVDNTSDAAKPVSTATQTALDGKQTLDADLTTISGLTATTDNFMVSVSSAWASRTPAQVKATLALDNVTNESKATMFTSPTLTGVPVIPTPFTLGATSVTATGTEINRLVGVTSGVQSQIDGKQASDADLTTIAGLTATTDNFLVSVSSAWASRTPAQVKTTLSPGQCHQ